MKSVVETIFKNLNFKLVQAFGRTGGVHHPVLPQSEEVRIKSMDSGCCFSIPCTPLPLYTSRTHSAPQSIKGVTQWSAWCVDAREQPCCSHAIVLAPVEETT